MPDNGGGASAGEVCESCSSLDIKQSMNIRLGPQATPQELHKLLEKSRDAYEHLRTVPAPRRGEILRQIREALAKHVGQLCRKCACGGLMMFAA
jgi:aldehyde dehydrogenase family 7 protein A1